MKGCYYNETGVCDNVCTRAYYKVVSPPGSSVETRAIVVTCEDHKLSKDSGWKEDKEGTRMLRKAHERT